MAGAATRTLIIASSKTSSFAATILFFIRLQEVSFVEKVGGLNL